MITAKEVAKLAVKALDSKKGIDLKLLEITDVSTLADTAGEPMVGREGHRGGTWVVLDYGCVVVHVFTEETRAFYDLERLWQDGKEVSLISVLNEN